MVALGIAAFLVWWFIYHKKDTSPQLETFDSESASQDRIRFINNDWCDYQGFNRAIKVCNNRVTCIRDLCDSGKYDGADGINACRPVYSHICDPHSEPKPKPCKIYAYWQNNWDPNRAKNDKKYSDLYEKLRSTCSSKTSSFSCAYAGRLPTFDGKSTRTMCSWNE